MLVPDWGELKNRRSCRLFFSVKGPIQETKDQRVELLGPLHLGPVTTAGNHVDCSVWSSSGSLITIADQHLPGMVSVGDR